MFYKAVELGVQRLDMIADGKVLVETKSTETLSRTAGRQVFNYLRASRLAVGLLLHFGPEPGFRRVFCRHAKRNRFDSQQSEASAPTKNV